MVSNDPSDRFENEKDALASKVEAGSVTAEDREAINDAIAATGKATSTQGAYTRCLRSFAVWADDPLTGMDTDRLNDEIQAFADERGWADSTLSQYQSALKAFLDYLEGEDAADEIEMQTVRTTPSIDPRTVLSIDEFHELRESTTKMRDRAMVDLFGYTGQRLRVIQTLRIRDVDVDEGVFYMPDAEGLKGADKQGQKRPLLGARDSVSDWIDMHPTGDPDDILITTLADGKTGQGEPGEPLAGYTINRRLKLIAERADIDKPVNPHAFRHFFVTVAKTQYDMEDGTIKHLIGHGPGSNIMETTYAHLSDDDHISAAREAMGMDADDDEKTMAPPTCPTCGTPLRPDAEACPTPGCREVFTPDAGPTPGEAVRAGYREAQDMETVEKLQMLDDLLQDPEVRDMIDEHGAEAQ